jgi:preprotein translocase subunit YajC
MRSRIAILATALVLGTAVLAAAQVAVESSTGTIVRIDPQSSVVMLDDGRMYRVTQGSVVLVDNRPATFATLRPGERVVIQSAEPVVYREGRYVTVQSSSPTVAAVPVGVRQTLYGTIDDVDRNGKVKIKTDRDSFEARVAPEALRQIRKGDNVVIDLTIMPPGTPAASPR